MNRSKSLFVSLLFSSLAVLSAGCGNSETLPEATDGGGADAGPPDANLPPTPLVFHKAGGTVIDYFAGVEDPVLGATVSTEGVNPKVETTVDAEGVFSMDVLANSLFYLSNSAPGFVLSRSAPIQMLESDLERLQFAASEVGVARQYTAAGVTKVAGNGIIMVELARSDGMPAENIPAANIVLTSIAQPGVAIGNAFLVDGATSDLSPNATTPTSEVDADSRYRAGFLNVAPGEYNISVTHLDDSVQTIFAIVPPDGASFILSSINGDGRGDPRIVLDPTVKIGFKEDIYPILQTVARGGDGCTACHDHTHPLSYIGTPEVTYELLKLDALDPVGEPLLNMGSPEQSPFLQNPVYEDVPNHPNVFWTVNSNHYKGIIAWIEQGAALLREDAVLP